MNWVYLTIAIITEVVATFALKLSNEFTNVVPSIVTIIGYGISFYFLSLVLKVMPVGVTYAIWSGVGITLLTIAGAFYFNQVPDLPAILGMALIIAGIVIMNIFSKTLPH